MIKKSLSILLFMISLLFMLPITNAQLSVSLHSYKVMFYGIKSLNNGLPLAGCQQMMHEIIFDSNGAEDFFDKKANPQYSDHKNVATLRLTDNQLLQMIQLRTRFDYMGKHYDFITVGSSVVYQRPFHVTGVVVSPYCKAAYAVVPNDVPL